MGTQSSVITQTDGSPHGTLHSWADKPSPLTEISFVTAECASAGVTSLSAGAKPPSPPREQWFQISRNVRHQQRQMVSQIHQQPQLSVALLNALFCFWTLSSALISYFRPIRLCSYKLWLASSHRYPKRHFLSNTHIVSGSSYHLLRIFSLPGIML